MGRIAERNKRRTVAKTLRTPPGAELRYKRALTRMMRTLHADAMEWLSPKLEQLTATHDQRGGTPATQLSSNLAAHVDGLVRQLAPKVVAPFSKLAATTVKQNARAMKALGLDLRGQLGPVIEHAREMNQRLITKAGRDYSAQIAEVLDDPKNYGLRHEELAAKLHERGDVSVSRAELIARDQASKLNGSVNRFRQTNAGVRSYVWSGSLDERERETHLANEGKTFDWNDPPAETGHPSEEIACRCCAVPLLEELGDEPAGDVPDEPPAGGGGGGGGGEHGGHGGGGAPPPPEDPPAAAAAPEEEPPRRAIEEGVHAHRVVVRNSVDADLADHVLTSQPEPVLDLLGRQKANELRIVRVAADPPGYWDPNSKAIQINAHTPPIAEMKRSPKWSVSQQMALRAAEANRGLPPAELEHAARRVRMQTTTTHEIGHAVHLNIRDDVLRRKVDQVVRDAHREARASGGALRISEYAAGRKPAEYFAEAFAARFHMPELLDDAASGMLEQVIRLVKESGK